MSERVGGEIGKIARELSVKLELLSASGVDESLLRRRSIGEINHEIEGCDRCSLSETRSRVFTGVGSGASGLFVVVERPFALASPESDVSDNEAYCGEEGGLLSDIITKGLKLDLKEVYLTFVIRCSGTQEVALDKTAAVSCIPYLVEEIEILNPKVVLCFGSAATEALLGPGPESAPGRGYFKKFGGTKVKQTCSLSELIKEPSLKRDVWNDIKLVATELKGR